MDDFVFSLTKEDEYYYKYIDQSKCNITYTYKKNNLFVKVLKKIDRFFISKNKKNKKSKFNNLVCKIAFSKKLINGIKNGTGVAILDSYVTEELLLYINNNDKNNNVFLVVWNQLTEENYKKYVKYLKKENIYSYSKNDCKRYGLNHTNDFHLLSLNSYFKKEPPTIDLYFLGRDKGRFDIIEKAAILMNNYKIQIDVFSGKSENTSSINGINFITKYISFDEYLNNVIKSKCLLDITNDNNISFRTIESLIFNIKLISTNVELKKYDFYNENNILIIDNKTTEKEINEFYEKPYSPISSEIVEKYDFYHTYDKFKKLHKIICKNTNRESFL